MHFCPTAPQAFFSGPRIIHFADCISEQNGFIQKGVLRGRLLGRIFDLSLQKQFFPIRSAAYSLTLSLPLLVPHALALLLPPALQLQRTGMWLLLSLFSLRSDSLKFPLWFSRLLKPPVHGRRAAGCSCFLSLRSLAFGFVAPHV